MDSFKVSDAIQENYDRYYNTSESEWRNLCALEKVDNIVKACEGIQVSSVVDIGAGDGAVAERLGDVQFSKELYALDISSSGVKAIRRRKIEDLVECRKYDGYHIPYDDKKFDLAILCHVLEHVEYPRKLLFEAERVAKYIYVEVPLEDNLLMKNDFVSDEVGHINFYTPKTIRRLIQSSGLEIVSQVVINPSKEVYAYRKGWRGYFNYYIKQYLLKIFPAVAVNIFTYHSAILCKKNSICV